MFKNIKKLKKLLDNYDKIMVLIDNKPEKSDDKRYSSLNTPKSQMKIIENLEKEGK